MQLANSTLRYGAVPQIIHWLTAIFVVCGFLLGQFLDVFPKGPARDDALVVHMTLGQCVVTLLVLRFIWRFVNPPPPPEPTPFGRFVEFAGRASHFVLYALLLVVPILGIMVQLRRGSMLPVFGLFDVASPWPADRELSRNILRAHAFLADALLILAGLHAAAALVHHWFWRDRTLTRMLPGAA